METVVNVVYVVYVVYVVVRNKESSFLALISNRRGDTEQKLSLKTKLKRFGDWQKKAAIPFGRAGIRTKHLRLFIFYPELSGGLPVRNKAWGMDV